MPQLRLATKAKNPFLEPAKSAAYLAARQERQDRQLKILAAGRLWRTIAVVAFISNIALATGIVTMTQMRKETPFVIAVDKWGYTVPIGKASPINTETYVHYHLKDFIRKARSISIDSFALEKAIKDAYSFVKKPSAAFNYLNEYYTKERKPFVLAKEVSIYVEDISIIRISNFSFRVRWQETTRNLSGQILEKNHHWGEFTYRLYSNKKQDPAERDSNPLALKIEQITWAKE